MTEPTIERRTSPKRALGSVPEGFASRPTAPTPDEQWHYLADHLAAIRRSLSIITAILVASIAIGFMVALANYA